MPTPIAHSVAAVIIHRVFRNSRIGKQWLLLAAVIALANAPDLDFIPGYFAGNPGAYHWAATHSLLAVVVVGLLAGILIGRRTGTYPSSIVPLTAAYGSHLLMDLMVGGPSPDQPYGLQLLWPVSRREFRLEWAVFEAAPESISSAGPIAAVLSREILPLIGRELLVMVPALIAVWVLTRKQHLDK